MDTWNQRGDDLRGVDAIAVIGNAGSYMPSLLSPTLLANASDGLVSLTSASLGFAAQTSATRVVPYCHVDPSAFTNTVFGVFQCNAAGIANVTSTSQYTGQIVRSFLAGTTAWSSIGTEPDTDPYLDSDGGLFFAMVNTTGSYVSDMTTVQWGTDTLQNGADTGTIFYTDFISGTGTYTAASQSLGSVNCGTLTQPAGYSWAVRCKIGATVFSVTPLADTSGRVLTAGTTVTLNGAALGSQCSACQVLAYPAGTTTSQALTVTSWQSTTISVNLPASPTGLVTLKVIAAAGTDTIGVMVAAAGSTSLGVSAQSLSFNYAAGGSAPAAQEVSITNSGSGTLSWTASADSFWIGLSAASGTAPDTLSISVNPANLAAGSHSGTVSVTPTGAGATPVSITVTLVVTGAQPAGTVAAVVNGASFTSGIASGGWVSIFGANLSERTYKWQASDIVNGMLPTSLQGVSVTIDGLPAYVEYISPSQINVLAPDDVTEGPVQVQVTTAQQASNAISAQKSAFAPAFFTFNGTYVAALHADYSVVGAANLLAGTVSTPAKPAETIMLYSTGFGPTAPAQPAGQQVVTPVPLANSVQVTIGGMPATVVYSGLTESGLYQFNVTVPNLPNGDATVTASIGGVASQTGVLLTVQQ